jgi:hypothetical protein
MVRRRYYDNGSCGLTHEIILVNKVGMTNFLISAKSSSPAVFGSKSHHVFLQAEKYYC